MLVTLRSWSRQLVCLVALFSLLVNGFGFHVHFPSGDGALHSHAHGLEVGDLAHDHDHGNDSPDDTSPGNGEGGDSGEGELVIHSHGGADQVVTVSPLFGLHRAVSESRLVLRWARDLPQLVSLNIDLPPDKRLGLSA